MINEEKIRKYLEEELSGEELKNFEYEISKSASLDKEVNNYRNTLDKLKNLKKIKAGEEYFANILPHFRSREEKSGRLNFKPAFAFGIVVLILLAVSLIFLMKDSTDEFQTEEITFQSIDRDELNEYLNNYSQELSSSQIIENISEDYDSLLNSMIEEELSLDNYSGDYFVDVSDNEFYYLLNQLSEEEMEGLYSTLLQEDFN